LGHNGAGKTTTIRMILGLTFPDAGHILFEGKPLSTTSKHLIGYMPEVNKLPGALTPAEILRQQLRLHRPASAMTGPQIKTAIDQSLEQVGLAEHRKKESVNYQKAWPAASLGRKRPFIIQTC